MLNNTSKFASALVAGLTVAATLAFAPAANAAAPAEAVYSPSISVAEDGSYNYVPGEWTGDITTLTVGWYSCPSAQLGAIGATAELLQQLTDAGCTFVSNDKVLPAETFDNVATFAVVIETADDTTSAYMGNNLVMYDKSGIGPVAYNMRGVSGTAETRTLYFDAGSAAINAKTRSGLYGLVSKIGSLTPASITINAYAAKGGSAKNGRALAKARARAIRAFFARQGITGPFKIHTHVGKASGAAGRRAIVKVDLGISLPQ
jgi:outer membrane protein OmpA-like peptidoglycan-associated protein